MNLIFGDTACSDWENSFGTMRLLRLVQTQINLRIRMRMDDITSTLTVLPYLKCPQQVWHMLRTYADFRVNHCGSWRMSADVRYKSADVRASVKACGLLRTFFRISWGYLFADVRSSMQVSLRTSAKACVKF